MNKARNLTIMLLGVYGHWIIALTTLQEIQQQAAQRQQIASMTAEQRALLQQCATSSSTTSSSNGAPGPSTNPAYDSGMAHALQFDKQAQEEFKARVIKKPGIYDKQSLRTGRVFQQLILYKNDRQPDENITCGPRTIMIAKTIDTLIEKGQDITPATIHAQLPKNYGAIVEAFLNKKQQLSSIEFLPFMNQHTIKLPHLLLLGSQTKIIVPPDTSKEDAATITAYTVKQASELGFVEDIIIPLGLTVEEENNIFTALDELPNRLRTLWEQLPAQPVQPVHIICSDRASGHWFLVSAIYYHGQRTLCYIDPKNVDFAKYPPAHKFIDYISTYMQP